MICHILLIGMQTKKGMEITMINIVAISAKNVYILRRYPVKLS